MSKRFTDTKKWNDDWYISLSNDYRIIWQWLLDNCNHAGFCKRSIGLINLMCRTNITEKEFIDSMDGRVIVHNDYWFIPKFIKFQYSTLLSCKPAIISVVKELFEQNCIDLIPESFGNNYKIIGKSFNNHCEMIKDKDKVKDKDKDKVKGGMGGILRGVKFSDDKTEVIFEDGTSQKLGNNQLCYLERNQLKPREVVKGLIS